MHKIATIMFEVTVHSEYHLLAKTSSDADAEEPVRERPQASSSGSYQTVAGRPKIIDSRISRGSVPRGEKVAPLGIELRSRRVTFNRQRHIAHRSWCPCKVVIRAHDMKHRHKTVMLTAFSLVSKTIRTQIIFNFLFLIRRVIASILYCTALPELLTTKSKWSISVGKNFVKH